VKIDKGLPGLRPGMTADVEILVTELQNVLSVPVSAVYRFDGKDHVAVKSPDGRFSWREVTLGLTNDKVVEVKDGLKSGEQVSVNPLAAMGEETSRTRSEPPTPPAAAPERPK